MEFENLTISESDGVALIELSRPDRANAFNGAMWQELKTAFDWLSAGEPRVGVLCGQGRHFTAGVDLEYIFQVKAEIAVLPEGLRQERLRAWIADLQGVIGAAESCRKPVIAAIHGACIGGGVDLVTACDMRYATREARFSIKEVDVAIVSDGGTLQRLPRVIGEGLARELAFTGREFDGEEAHAMGLVNQVFDDRDSLMEQVMAIAASIAKKSPHTIRGVKDVLNYSRDHSVAEGLEYVALRNAGALFTSDVDEAVAAIREKRKANYGN